jgi:non-ribosomal peptide synthetase component F
LSIITGPTEAHVVTSYTVISSNELLFLPPIGKPIANTKIFILDANLNPLPPGIYGEIHIGGVQLARGYLNNEALTQEKFIPNPFDKTERLYKTGDIGRWLIGRQHRVLG